MVVEQISCGFRTVKVPSERETWPDAGVRRSVGSTQRGGKKRREGLEGSFRLIVLTAGTGGERNEIVDDGPSGKT